MLCLQRWHRPREGNSVAVWLLEQQGLTHHSHLNAEQHELEAWSSSHRFVFYPGFQKNGWMNQPSTAPETCTIKGMLERCSPFSQYLATLRGSHCYFSKYLKRLHPVAPIPPNKTYGMSSVIVQPYYTSWSSYFDAFSDSVILCITTSRSGQIMSKSGPTRPYMA